ncbi:TVP38/TMEM64 family protein [Arenibaculum pallidiluteum]|uniref:TVP38/TMEM64 family protein n=1 Tax=Arenibaculum pallidiluteum TaxID=2812559 RepID=UPI001A9773B0|nr:TVP38/TMEM64 family protein [Arenibaculum pallidiluteum]
MIAAEEGHRKQRRAGWIRFWPLLAAAAAVTVVFALDLHRLLSFEALAAHRGTLLAWVEAHGPLAAGAFVLTYAAATALSLPGGTVLTLAGGFLFGIPAGTACSVIGGTLGAVAVFLAARTALGGALRRRAGPSLDRFAEGFRRDAFSYLLVLRLVPLFPFWLVNLVPAFLGVRLGTYAAATAIGIVPGTLAFASAGAGLGTVFEAGETPDAGILLRPGVLLPLLGLAALALVPILYRRLKAGRSAP